jgi:DNA polymerase V
MEDEFYGAAYRGSKQFSQQEIRTANATGFGAAADDYMERGIDLNEQLILNKPATFFFRMKGDAMKDIGVFDGDVLIVDRSIKTVNGKLIVASVDGEMLVRRFQQTFNKVTLTAENKKYKPIEVGEYSTYTSFGVVTCVIHILDSMLHTKLIDKKK